MARFPPRDTYTPELAGKICMRIAAGEPLRKICGPDKPRGIPDRVTVYNWLNRHPQFMKAYRVARRAQAELFLDEVVEIADGPIPPDGGEGPRDVPRDRLRVETRFKLAAMMAPRDGNEGEEALGRFRLVETMDDHERAARIAAIMEAARRRMIEKQEQAAAGAMPEPAPAPFFEE